MCLGVFCSRTTEMAAQLTKLNSAKYFRDIGKTMGISVGGGKVGLMCPRVMDGV